MPKVAKPRKRAAGRLVICPHCKEERHSQGLANHVRACLRESSEHAGPTAPLPAVLMAFYQDQTGQDHSADPNGRDPFGPYRRVGGRGVSVSVGRMSDGECQEAGKGQYGQELDSELSLDPTSPLDHTIIASPATETTCSDQSNSPDVDSIRVDHHPSSGQQTEYFSYEQYTSALPEPDPTALPSANQEPWSPFRTRLNFELAEFMQENRLNEGEIKRLLSIVDRVASRPSQYSIVDMQDLKGMWKAATTTHAAVLRRIPLTLTFRGEEMEYDVWACDIWDWCLELLQDPVYVRQMRWHALRLSRFDGREWVRFINEPWTADRWWLLQCQLPTGVFPFCIILYADKTKLSNMGTKKGYPVYVRCANLPAELRNGKGLAGGRLVGLLPIVTEDADKKNKTAFVDFKRIVWHAGVEEFLKTIRHIAAAGGFKVQCGDGILRLIIPIILILIADYEEQCVMAAIRGINSSYPCPICLVPNEELSAVSKDFPLRTTEDMAATYASAEQKPAAERNETLKAKGLRFLKNLFWSISWSDVYLALSFDRLHAFNGGLFSDHLLEQHLDMLDHAVSRELRAKFELQLRTFPRWRDLNHFSDIASFREFTDGRKYEDLSKIIIYIAHNVLAESDEPLRGLLLLQLTRSYLELDMYASLRSHTAHTLHHGRQELRRWEKELKAYIALHGAKNWNFPKAHTFKHMFDDIQLKGVTRNFNSKYSEEMHGMIKELWNISNFKNIEPQLARINAQDMSCKRIREGIVRHDTAKSAVPGSLDTLMQQLDVGAEGDGQATHLTVGSPVPGVPLNKLASHFPLQFAPCFWDIRKKIGTRLSAELQCPINISESCEVTLYRYAKVDYVSMEDSTVATDFLRMNPNFHGHERYDFGLLSVYDEGYLFAQVLGVIGITIDGTEYLIAIVVPFDEPVGGDTPAESRRRTKRDQDLRLHRFRTRRKAESAVVFARTIVRGALLVTDHSNTYGDEFFAVDVVDADMWLRMKTIQDKFVIRAKI